MKIFVTQARDVQSVTHGFFSLTRAIPAIARVTKESIHTLFTVSTCGTQPSVFTAVTYKHNALLEQEKRTAATPAFKRAILLLSLHSTYKIECRMYHTIGQWST